MVVMWAEKMGDCVAVMMVDLTASLLAEMLAPQLVEKMVDMRVGWRAVS